jgi:tetratricopeptide (TPR) repeat protein
MKSNNKGKASPEELITVYLIELESTRNLEEINLLLPVFSKLGQAYLEGGDAPKALTQFDEGLEVSKGCGDKKAEAQFLGLRGLALRQIGNFSQAMQQFNKSNRLASDIEEPLMECDSLVQIGMLLSDRGEITKSIAKLAQAFKIARIEKDSQRKMRIASILADNFLKENALDKAVEYFVMAYELAHELKNYSAECTFLTHIGNVFLLEGEYDSAIGQYERGLEIAGKLEDTNLEINILGGLFRANAQIGKTDIAIMYADKAIHSAASINHWEAESINLQTLVSFLVEKQYFKKAEIYIAKSFELSDEQQDPNLKQMMYITQGDIYYAKDEFDDSISKYDLAIESSVSHSNILPEILALTKKSSVLAEKGEIEQAIDIAIDGLAKAHKTENIELISDLQAMLAINYFDIGENDKAIQHCKDAINHFEITNDLQKLSIMNDLLVSTA